MARTIRLTRRLLVERAERVRKVNERTVTAGMTRPARPKEKRATLEKRGGLGPFSEGSTPRPTQRPARRG